MLFILLSALILIPTFIGIGRFSEKLSRLHISSISLHLIFGIMGISLLWTIAAFFFPIHIFIEIPTIMLGWFGFFYFKDYKKLFEILRLNKISFLLLSLTISLVGAFYPFILDHFGYYVPTINWIKEFGLTKGVSNMDLILGQMSIWHILQAGFSSFADPFFRLNSVLLIVYLLYIFEHKSWLHLLFLPFLFLFSQSPSPDLATIVFSLIILNELMFSNKNAGFLFALSSFIFAIKPTMIWVPILVFLYNVFILKSKTKFLVSGILILGLFAIKNVWTFGYPIFPVQFLDFNLPWKPSPITLKDSAESAIMKTYDMQYSYQEISQFSTFDYIKNWFTLKGMKSIINIGYIISILIFGIYVFMKKNRIITFIFISILIKSCFVLWFSAQYRFFIDVFFVIAFVLLNQKINYRMAIYGFSILSLTIITFLSIPNLIRTLVPSFRLGNYMMGFQPKQFLKPSTFELNQYSNHQIGNLKFNLVKNYPFSFDTPAPSISPYFLKQNYNASVFPQAIDNDIKKGLIWRKITPNEREKLKEILDTYYKTYQQK